MRQIYIIFCNTPYILHYLTIFFDIFSMPPYFFIVSWKKYTFYEKSRLLGGRRLFSAVDLQAGVISFLLKSTCRTKEWFQFPGRN